MISYKTLNSILLRFVTAFISFGILLSCGEDVPIDEPNATPPGNEDKTGIQSFTNPAEGRVITPGGETITCVLFSDASYEAELVLHSGEDGWAVMTKGDSGEKGRNNIRIVFE